MNYFIFFMFAGLGLIWGSNFIYMKMASEYVSAQQIVLLRVLFGFLPVVVYAVVTKQLKIAHLRYSGHFFVMSLLATSVYYFAFAKGAELLLSGVAGALSGSIPIFTTLLAVVFLKSEKASMNKLLGISLGLTGVLLISNPFTQNLEQTNIEGVLYMVLGALSIGASFIYARYFITGLKLPAAALTTYQLGFSLFMLSVVTDWSSITVIIQDTHALLGLIIGLGLLGTGLAYIIYYYIIEQLGAVAAASVTYIPPIVALLISALLVGEAIKPLDYLATLFIFMAIFLTNKPAKRKKLS